jgi:hypothetical protein
VEQSWISKRIKELNLGQPMEGKVMLRRHSAAEVQTELFVLVVFLVLPDYVLRGAKPGGWFENHDDGGVTFYCDPTRADGARHFSCRWFDIPGMLKVLSKDTAMLMKQRDLAFPGHGTVGAAVDFLAIKACLYQGKDKSHAATHRAEVMAFLKKVGCAGMEMAPGSGRRWVVGPL